MSGSLICLNERHLHRVLSEYTAYYNAQWPHKGIEQDSPQGLELASPEGLICYRYILGGIIRDYLHYATQLQIQGNRLNGFLNLIDPY